MAPHSERVDCSVAVLARNDDELKSTAAISTTIFPVVTCSPSATSIAETVPATPAVCTCSIFIASSVITGWPAATCSPGLTSTATTRPFIAARTLPSPPAAAADTGAASVRSRTAMRDAAMQEIEPVAVAQKFCAIPSCRRCGSGSYRGRVRRSRNDARRPRRRRHSRHRARARCSTSCTPWPRSIRIGSGNVAARTASAAPWRRMRIGDVKQQRRQRGFRVVVRARRQQFVAMLADERRGRLALGKAGMAQAGNQKSLIGGDAERRGLLQSADQPAPRLVAVGAMADDLGDHRIVERRNLGAGLQRVLDADAVRHLPQRHPARLRHEIMAGVLGAQPHLDRVAGEFDVLLLEPERLAARRRATATRPDRAR